MSQVNYIDKDRVIPQSIDYEHLRVKGLEYIEQLSNKLWTDYNSHDPGITTLEALTYALTELGYRNQFDIKDILADPDGKIRNNTFFTAQKILTNAALTELDFRKLLIDIDGINNAWVKYSKKSQDEFGYNRPLDNEIPIYSNPLEDKLSLKSTDKIDRPLNRLAIRGLNQVYVELGNDIDFGDLNEVSIRFAKYVEPDFLDVNITTDFNRWNDPKAGLFKLMNRPHKIVDKQIEQDVTNKLVRITVKRASNPSQSITLELRSKDVSELDQVMQLFESEKQICDIIDLLKLKKEKVDAIFSQVYKRLYENRNLNEDWFCIETIKRTQISICADIHLKPNVDVEGTLAKIYQAIQYVMDPPIRFYTLNQLFDKGYGTTDIFDGPILTNGFLIDEEVEAAKLPVCLKASDFISSIMEIDGVEEISNFLFTAYDAEGKPLEMSKNESWCLDLDGVSKPVLSIDKSKLLLFKNKVPFTLSQKGEHEFALGLDHLKVGNDAFKLVNISNDIPVPDGNYYDLNEYESVQYEYPLTYRIGKDQMAKSATKERKAQAKQLKAYLQHFDQLLADSFNQLHNAKKLLDTNTLDRTYFPTFLENIDGVELADFKDEVYTDNFKNVLLPSESPNQNSLYETKEEFYKRRNQFLDHLMARFAESFNEYVLMLYRVRQDANGLAELKIQEQELIEDKQRFLNNYPEISANRGLGFNYLKPTASEIWDVVDKSGFEKRIALLLGINNFKLTDCVLHGDTPQNSWHYNTSIGKITFKLSGIAALNLQEKWDLAHKIINDVASYKIRKASINYIIDLVHDDIRIAKLVRTFSTRKEANDFIPTLYQAINSSIESLYCIEHILLRPLIDIEDVSIKERDQHLLGVCLGDDCYTGLDEDPYSFKTTIVLRGDLPRFRNIHFRKYAESLIRQEAPAHALLKICWVSKNEMLAFQIVYKEWIAQYRKIMEKLCSQDISNTLRISYNKSLKLIVQKIKELNTIYQAGTLHDCQLEAFENPIVLGNTALGSL